MPTKSKTRVSKALGESTAERYPVTYPVTYGGVSIGEHMASMGVRTPRERINIMAADRLFCGKRLVGEIVVHAADEDAAQTHFDGLSVAHRLRGSFDVKRFSVSPKYISAHLTFTLSEIEVGELAEFSKRCGTLIVEQVLGLEASRNGQSMEDKDEE